MSDIQSVRDLIDERARLILIVQEGPGSDLSPNTIKNIRAEIDAFKRMIEIGPAFYNVKSLIRKVNARERMIYRQVRFDEAWDRLSQISDELTLAYREGDPEIVRAINLV